MSYRMPSGFLALKSCAKTMENLREARRVYEESKRPTMKLHSETLRQALYMALEKREQHEQSRERESPFLMQLREAIEAIERRERIEVEYWSQ